MPPVQVNHQKVSLISDGDNPTKIQPSDWNETHTITGMGDAATKNVGVTVDDVAAGDHTHTDLAPLVHTHADLAPLVHLHADLATDDHTHADLAPLVHTHADLAPLAHTHLDLALADHTHLDLALADHTHPDIRLTPNSWVGAQRYAFHELFSTAGLIAINAAAGNNFRIQLTEDAMLETPTNAVEGQAGVIYFVQDNIIPMTLTFDPFWEFGDGIIPTMTTTLGGVSIMSYIIDPAGTAATCIAWTNKS